MNPEPRLRLFTRAPLPGSVKTRLSPFLTEAAAAELCRAFLLDLAVRFHPSHRFEVWFTPGGSRRVLAELLPPEIPLLPQPEGDLGDRLAAALEDAAPDAPVLIIGSDAPDLPGQILTEALEALAEHDIALSPAADGGFVMIASRSPLPPGLLAGLPWSEETVLAELESAVSRSRLSSARVTGWSDVDTPADLLALAHRLAVDPSPCPHTARFLQSLPQIAW